MSTTLEEALNRGLRFEAPQDVGDKLSASLAFAHRYLGHPEGQRTSTRYEINTGLDELGRDFVIYSHPQHGPTIAMSHEAYETVQRAARGVPMGDAAARQSAERVEDLHRVTMEQAAGITHLPAPGSPIPSAEERQTRDALIDAAVIDSRRAHAQALGLGDRITSIVPLIPTPSAGAQLHDTATLLAEAMSGPDTQVSRLGVLRTLARASQDEHAPVQGSDGRAGRPQQGVGAATAGIRNALADLMWRAYSPAAHTALANLAPEARQQAFDDVSGAVRFQDRDPGMTGWEGPVQIRPGVMLSPRRQQRLNGTSAQGTNILTGIMTAIRSRWGAAGEAGISGYLRMNAGLGAALAVADRLGLPRAHPLLSVAREGTATALAIARQAHARTRGAAKSAAGDWLADARRADRGVRNHEFMAHTAEEAKRTAARFGSWVAHDAGPAAGKAALFGGAVVTSPIWGPPVLAYKAGKPVVQAAGRAAGRAAQNAGDVLSQPAARDETSLQDLDQGHGVV